MSFHPPGKAPQHCAASFAGGTIHVPSASNTLLLIHPASNSLSHQGQPRRRHVRSRPRGSTSVALASTDRSSLRQAQRCPRAANFGVGAGRGGGGGVAWRALRTAASPTTAEVVDAANTGALDSSSGEGRQREGLAGGGGLDEVSGRVGEERAVNGGTTSRRVQQQQRGSMSSRPKLPAQGTPEAARMVTEAKKLSSTASALMRRMTNAGKRGRWVSGGGVGVARVETGSSIVCGSCSSFLQRFNYTGGVKHPCSIA